MEAPLRCPLNPADAGTEHRTRPGIRRGAAQLPALLALVMLTLSGVPALAAQLTVEISGLSRDQKANVEAFLSIYRERERSELQDSRIRRLHGRAADEIRQALSPFGFYRVQVDGELEDDGAGGWVARYRVDPGAPVQIGSVDVRLLGEGENEPGQPALGLASGQVLFHPDYEAAKSRLRAFAQDRGFLDARYTISRVVVDPEAYRADVTLHLDTGPRYYFGPLGFQQEGFDPEFLLRFADFEHGDPFRFARLLDLQSALFNTDFFSHVEVTPRIGEAQEFHVPVDIELTRNKTNRYRAGVGFATDTGPRVSLDWTRRFLGKKGHSAGAALSLSPDIQRLEAGYRIPLADPRREHLSFNSSLENYDTAGRSGAVLSLRAEHNVFHGNWQRTLGLDYDFESPRARGEDDYFILVPNATLVWKVLDDPIYVTRGARLDLNLSGALEPILSNSTFLQGRARAKGIYMPREKLRLIGRAELGMTLANDLQEIPPSRRFYAGGDNSIRGYGFETISPRNEFGARTGARHLLTASIELERRLTPSWSVATFYDTGSAFDTFSEVKLVEGAGLGVRWLSPVGLVRLDLAVPFDDTGFQVHLGIGPDL